MTTSFFRQSMQNPVQRPTSRRAEVVTRRVSFEVARLQSRIGQRPLITVAWGIAPGIVSNGSCLAEGHIHR